MIAGDAVAVEDRCGERAVQHRVDAGFGDELVGDDLESLGVEFVGVGLALGDGRTHLGGARLELAADAVRLDRLLVSIPGHSLDTDCGDVAPETTEPFDQCDVDAGPRRGERSGQTGGTRSDDEHRRSRGSRRPGVQVR